MPLRDERQRQAIMPDPPGYPELIEEPVRPGPAPEERVPTAPGMPEEPAIDDLVPTEEDPGGIGPELPTYATVMDASGDSIVLQCDKGEVLRVHKEAFPFEPREGMHLMRAMVVEVTDDTVIARVGEERGMVDIPTSRLDEDFDVGDFFWMPEPPTPPDEIEPEAEED